MGSGNYESPKELLFAFCQEFFGSIFMFILFFPVGAILGDTLDGWVFHFLAVIVFDISTAGACANPAMCTALFFAGKLPFIGTIIRVIAELLAGIIGFSFLHAVMPTRFIARIGGPELDSGVSIFYGVLIEGLITFLFALTVLLASSFVTDPEISRPLFAAVLRILIVFGGPLTGANMNSMIGFSWAWYTNRLYSQEYQMVYSLAPIIGSLFAAGAYFLILNILPSKIEIFDNDAIQKSNVNNDEILEKRTPTKKVASKIKKESSDSSKKTPKSTSKMASNGDSLRPKTRSQTVGPELRKRIKK
jgi:glycerol uptake facilitator-like aquaporin